MALSDEEAIQLIIASIGGDTADGLLAQYLPTYWAAHEDAGSEAARILLTTIDGIDLLLGQMWRRVDFKALDGASVNLSDMFDHLLKLRGLKQGQIDTADAAANAYPAVGELEVTTPIPPPCGYPFDANAPAYRGNAYPPRRRRRP